MSATQWVCQECSTQIVIEKKEIPYMGQVNILHCECSFATLVAAGKMSRSQQDVLDGIPRWKH